MGSALNSLNRIRWDLKLLQTSSLLPAATWCPNHARYVSRNQAKCKMLLHHVLEYIMYIIEGREIGMLLTSVNPVKYDAGWYLPPSMLCPILKQFTWRCLLNANISMRKLINPLFDSCCLILKWTLKMHPKFFYCNFFNFFVTQYCLVHS
jgi:hypothetical protein